MLEREGAFDGSSRTPMSWKTVKTFFMEAPAHRTAKGEKNNFGKVRDHSNFSACH